MEKGGDRLRVTGGRRLKGTVRISGAKNAVLPILAATLLSPGETVIHDAPAIRDVAVMTEILRRLGAAVERAAGPDGLTLTVSAAGLHTAAVHADLTREMRSSIFLMGPLLGRFGEVRIAYPGGCAIGPRPIDFHLRGLRELGAVIEEEHGYLVGRAPGGLQGTEIYLDFPSVGATENLMMAAVLARGTTVIRGAAREPELVDLQTFLNAMGARVRGAGLDVIRIDGVERLGGCEHTVIPDRIEAGSFMAAAAITGGDVVLENVIPEHVEAAGAKLREMGAEIEELGGRLRVRGPARLQATDIKTLPYPGFPTDMQPQLMALATVARGTSIVAETIFENRFRHAEELRRMGAQVNLQGRTAVVKGGERLSGALVSAPALREGMCLVLAGLVADGKTEVDGAHHIDRGYEHLERKLAQLGAAIERLPGAAAAPPVPPPGASNADRGR